MRRRQKSHSKKRSKQRESQTQEPRRGQRSGRRKEAHPHHRQRGKGGGFQGRTLVGKVQKSQRGFAFLLPEDRSQRDAFVPPEEAAFLMQDDKVRYTVQRRGTRLSARIVEILERRQKRVLGELQQDRRRWLLISLDGDAFEVLEPQKLRAQRGWVEAKIVEYPSRTRMGAVHVEEYLGDRLEPKHDVKLAATRFGLAQEFSMAAMRDCEKSAVAMEEILRLLGSRRDLRKLPFVTIDGEDAKDFDDAIYVERPASGAAFILYVAIADVAFFVRPRTAVDDEALVRGTSTYFPGIALPMLPERLSNDLCSLRPQIPRLTMTAEIHYDRDGNVEKTRFYESLIQTAARLTYEQVQIYFDKKQAMPQVLNEPLQAALALYRKLLKQRAGRGVLEFDLPEAFIEVDAEYKPVAVHAAERYDSHKLIEEFMIAANQAVARVLRENHIPSLYRVHEPPDPDSLEEINTMLRALGVPQRLKEMSGHALGQMLQATTQHRAHRTIHQAVLRSQKQARYEQDPGGHFGLALRDYTHFTSPIRRYPDLVVHRSLKRLIAASKRADTDSVSEDSLEDLGRRTSEAERRSMEAERFVRKRKQCWYMLERIGEIYDAQVSGLNGKGLFIEIPVLLIEGFLSREDLNGHYEFDEERMCYRKRPGHLQLVVGDPIRVEVASVILEENQIAFVEVEDRS